MIDIMTRLNQLIDKHASDEEYKKILGSLSGNEWEFIVRELPKTPYLGRLGKLRKESLEEKIGKEFLMKTIKDLDAVTDNPNCTDEDLKQYVGTLTEEEWKYVAKQLPKNPFLGKLDNLREQYLKEHKETTYDL